MRLTPDLISDQLVLCHSYTGPLPIFLPDYVFCDHISIPEVVGKAGYEEIAVQNMPPIRAGPVKSEV